MQAVENVWRLIGRAVNTRKRQCTSTFHIRVDKLGHDHVCRWLDPVRECDFDKAKAGRSEKRRVRLTRCGQPIGNVNIGHVGVVKVADESIFEPVPGAVGPMHARFHANSSGEILVVKVGISKR